MTSYKLSENWEKEIRLDYQDILDEQEIEETVKYWRGVIELALSSQLKEVLNFIEEEEKKLDGSMGIKAYEAWGKKQLINDIKGQLNGLGATRSDLGDN